MKKDLYLNDLAEETGKLFETYDLERYDMNDIIPIYMKSNFRYGCDIRNARQATALAWEQKIHLNDELSANNIVPNKNSFLQYDPVLCSWIGEFYTYFQAYTGWQSKKIINELPFKDMYIKGKGLHDLNPQYAVKKLVKEMKIKDSTGIQIATFSKDELICFWKTTDEYGCFSNWYLSNFIVDGITFYSGEQWFMYQKAQLFKDYEIAKQILMTPIKKVIDNVNIKYLGRKVSNFDENVWNENCENLIYKGLLEKFKQNEDLKNKLIETKDKYIVEASPVDIIWGVGLVESKEIYNPMNWKGQNKLGEILMEIRYELQPHM